MDPANAWTNMSMSAGCRQKNQYTAILQQERGKTGRVLWYRLFIHCTFSNKAETKQKTTFQWPPFHYSSFEKAALLLKKRSLPFHWWLMRLMWYETIILALISGLRFWHCCSSKWSARTAVCTKTCGKTGNLQQIHPSFLRSPAKSHTPGKGSSLSTEKAEASILQLNLEFLI